MKRWFRRLFFASVLSTALFVVAAPGLLLGYVAAVDHWTAKLDRGGPMALSTLDCAAIYALNLAMAVGGLPLAPEASLETALLTLPSGGTRDFESDFAMASPKVRKAVDRLAKGSEKQTVRFDYGDEPRVGLALNALTLTGDRQGDELHVTGSVKVSYARRYRLRLFRLGPLDVGIEEGLFRALQDRGWLHPYVARWHWTVSTA